MISIFVNIKAVYRKPDINDIWFKDRNPYSEYKSVEEFCYKRGFTLNDETNTIFETKTRTFTYDNFLQYISNLENDIKESCDKIYSHGLYLETINFDIVKISGIIDCY